MLLDRAMKLVRLNDGWGNVSTDIDICKACEYKRRISQIYVYIYMYTCIYIYVYVCVYTDTSIYQYI